MVHMLKWISMGCSVMYVMLSFAVLAVSISWYVDGVKTGTVQLNYSHVLEVVIALGFLLAVVGFVGCIGSLNDGFNMTAASAGTVLLVAIGFAAVSGFLGTNFAKAEADLRMQMTKEMVTYPGQNETNVYWDKIQVAYNCCGIDGADDWIRLSRIQVIPRSCIPTAYGTVSFLPGCYSESLRPAQKAVIAGVSTTAVMATVLLIGFVCNVVFCVVLKRARDKEL